VGNWPRLSLKLINSNLLADIMNLIFEYAIKNKSGLFYNGNAYGDSRDWSSIPMDVYTYTEAGAYRKISLFPAMFAGCEVVRFI
jgi:hypothetical protein